MSDAACPECDSTRTVEDAAYAADVLRVRCLDCRHEWGSAGGFVPRTSPLASPGGLEHFAAAMVETMRAGRCSRDAQR